MDRLLQVQEREVRIDFQMGCKCQASIRLKNMMQTMPVAFKVQTTSPAKFSVKPPNGFIHPNAEFSFQIILKPQYDMPENFPLSKEKFLVKSILVPMSSGGNLPDRVPSDWFAVRTSKVFVDARLRVVYIGDLLLRYLVAREDISSVKHILKRQTCSDGCDEAGRTAIHIAAANGNLEMVQALLEGGSKIHLLNKKGQTPLLEAAYMGEMEVMKVLLDNGADINEKDFRGWTAIHLASMLNHLEIVCFLIGRGVNLDAQDNEGRTALHSAVTEGHIECVKLLLEAGANKNACSVDGRSAIFRAAARGNVEIVKLMMDLGANPAIKTKSGQSPFDIALEKGHTAVMDALRLGEELLKAARRGEVKAVTSSLKKGADVKGRDQWGWTALHCASLKGHVEVVAKLLEYGADVRQSDLQGHTALHCAVEGGHKEVAQLLVSKGAEIDAKNMKGVTPLQIAAALRYNSISKFLTMMSSAARSVVQAKTMDAPAFMVSPKLSFSSSMKVTPSSNSILYKQATTTDGQLQEETVAQNTNSVPICEEKQVVKETRQIWSSKSRRSPALPPMIMKQRGVSFASGPLVSSTTPTTTTKTALQLPIRASQKLPNTPQSSQFSSPHQMDMEDRDVSDQTQQYLKRSISSIPRFSGQTPCTKGTEAQTVIRETNSRASRIVTRSSSLYSDRHHHHQQQQQLTRYGGGKQLRELLEQESF